MEAYLKTGGGLIHETLEVHQLSGPEACPSGTDERMTASTSGHVWHLSLRRNGQDPQKHSTKPGCRADREPGPKQNDPLATSH